MIKKIKDLAAKLGVLRLLLVLIVLWFVVSAPFAGTEIVYSGWSMVPTLLVPVLVPIVFFVLPMDITMSRVFMSDAEGDVRNRYKLVIIMDIALFVVLLVAWLPYFVRLVRI